MTTQTIVGTPVLPRVNLLPPEIAEARTLRQYRLGAAGGVVLTAVAVGVFYWSSHGSVASAQTSLDAANANTAKLKAETAQFSYVTTLQGQVASAKATLASALAPQVLWSRYLQDMSVSLPGNYWFSTMVLNSTAGSAAALATTPLSDGGAVGTITLVGHAVSHYDVASLLRALDLEQGLSHATFASSLEDSTAIQDAHKLDNFTVNVFVDSNQQPAATPPTTTPGS